MRRYAILSTVIIIILVLISIEFFNVRNDNMNLSGNLIISQSGYFVYNLANNRIRKLNITSSISTYNDIELNSNFSKFITYDCQHEGNKYKYTINEVNIKARSKKDITSFYLNTIDQNLYVKYVPKSNYISYIKDDKLTLYNLRTQREKALVNIYDDLISSYSWSNDGNNVIYVGTLNTIYKYNRINKHIDKILKGSCPLYSRNSNYIAFSNNDASKLYLYNVSNKGIKQLSDIDNACKCFSPDDKYIAVGENKMILGCISIKNTIINIATGRKKTLYTGKQASNSFDWSI